MIGDDVSTTSTSTSTGRETCPACREATLRPRTPSRRTGLVIQDCPACGVHALADREAVFAGDDFEHTDRESYAAYMAITRTGVLDTVHREVLTELDTLAPAGPGGRRRLFDVGAGDGRFLAGARTAGFEPHGNELALGAVELAREVNDVELLHGDLAEHPDAGPYEAVTMWCVLAHVPHGEPLLREVGRVLAPGGVLFLQTPRWSLMDRLGMLAHRLSGGRLTTITDRRVAAHHMTLHSTASLTALLQSQGLEVLSVRPAARYSLTTSSYLQSLRVPAPLARRLASALDALVDRGWFFRNVLDAYARRPVDVTRP